jgi:hypothetical protein
MEYFPAIAEKSQSGRREEIGPIEFSSLKNDKSQMRMFFLKIIFLLPFTPYRSELRILPWFLMALANLLTAWRQCLGKESKSISLQGR